MGTSLGEAERDLQCRERTPLKEGNKRLPKHVSGDQRAIEVDADRSRGHLVTHPLYLAGTAPATLYNRALSFFQISVQFEGAWS